MSIPIVETREGECPHCAFLGKLGYLQRVSEDDHFIYEMCSNNCGLVLGTPKIKRK